MSCCEMFLVFSSSGWTVIDSVLGMFTTMSARSWHSLATLVTEIVPDDLLAPTQPASNHDTTNVDWATVAEIHTGADFDAPVDVTQPMPTPDELPQLTTLGMLTTMIDRDGR